MYGVSLVTEFTLLFEERLPNSFNDVLPYISAKYDHGQKQPQLRSLSDCHNLLVSVAHLRGYTFPKFDARHDEAYEHDRHQELLDALAIPFVHIDDEELAAAKICAFLTDCENLSEPAFQALLGYLLPPSTTPLWDEIRWRFIHALPKALLVPLAVVAGVFFYVQYVLGLSLVGGAYQLTFLGHRLTLTVFQILLTSLGVALFILCLFTPSFVKFLARLTGALIIVIFFPLYIILRTINWFMRKISLFPYESFYLQHHFEVHKRLGQVITLVSGNMLALFSVLNIGLFPGTMWSNVNVFFALGSLIILASWFYFWNFQPLLFLDSGMKTYVYLSISGIPSKEGLIRDKRISREHAEYYVEKLHRVDRYFEGMEELIKTTHNRFDVFAASCFIALLLAFLITAVVVYSVVYWGLYAHDPSYFQLSSAGNNIVGILGYHEFAILSLNNLPIGGSLHLKGGTLAIECLLFSERLYAAGLLVIAIFAYSTVSGEQIAGGKADLLGTVKRYRSDVVEKLKTYERLFNLS